MVRIGILLALLVGIGGMGFYLASQPAPPPPPSATPGTDPGDGDTASGGQGQPVDGIECQAGEQLAFHVHAHLFILLDGVPQPVSARVGIVAKLPPCIYWLHTHDRSGIIHIEAPAPRKFTLGEFFDTWGRPLSRNGVSTLDVPGGDLTVFVDGKAFDGDPRDIELKAHTQVVIELGTPVAPPAFEFPAGA